MRKQAHLPTGCESIGISTLIAMPAQHPNVGRKDVQEDGEGGVGQSKRRWRTVPTCEKEHNVAYRHGRESLRRIVKPAVMLEVLCGHLAASVEGGGRARSS